MSVEMIGVFAGNSGQFQRFLRGLDKSEDNRNYFYIRDANDLRGRRNFRIIYFGTWYQRPDMDRIETEIHIKKTSGDILGVNYDR